MDAIVPKYWHVYTDGSAYGGPPYLGGWGFVRVSPHGIRVERAGSVRGYRAESSERMELMAVVAALVSIPIPGQMVVVHTDCEAIIHRAGRVRRCGPTSSILRSWIDAKFRRLMERHAVLFVKEGRPNPGPLHPENQCAHRLARGAINSSRPRTYSHRAFRRCGRFPVSDSQTRIVGEV